MSASREDGLTCDVCGDPIRKGELRQWVLGSDPERYKHFGCGAKPGSTEATAAAALTRRRSK